MNKEKITLIAVGDLGFSGTDPKAMSNAVDVLRSGDITFGNCDQVYSDKGYPSPIHASRGVPENIPALVHCGVDVISLANNHTLDWGTEALLDEIDRMNKAGIKVVGVGKNVAEARQPVIFEKKGNKVGILAYGCIGPDGYEAWDDKPGHAPMRSLTVYEKWDYQPGTPPRIITQARKEDLVALENDIRKLKSQVDVTVVYFHWGLHFQPALIPMYGFEIGHAACDFGADIVLGNHAHIAKCIEVYKGKVIFHGQADFPMGGGSHSHGSEPYPRKWDVYKGGKILQEFYSAAPDPEHFEVRHPERNHTMIAKIIINQGKINKVSYLPCYISKESKSEIMTRKDPKGQEVFDYIEKISRSQNLTTRFTWEGDEVLIST